MKQVIQNYRTGILKVDDVPPPAGRSGSLLVANHFSLISPGTEKSTVEVAQKSLIGKAMERPEMARKVIGKIRKDGLIDTMKMVFQRLDTPVGLGYSCAGTVLEAGEGAAMFSAGERVACAGQNYASHAEVVEVPKNLCVKIPEGVGLDEAAFVTLGAIALQGIRQTEPRLGDRVAVIGLGLLGQLTVQMLKAAGCLVLASDIDEKKRVLAGASGADLIVPPERLPEAAEAFTNGHGVDAVIITASTKENGPVEAAGAIARKKGRIVVVGAVGMSLPREPYYKKELELRLSTSYGPGRYDPAYEEKGQDYPYGYVRWTENRNMEAFLTLIQQKKVDVKRLITRRYPIQEAEQAYTLMMENREPVLGILISYPSAVEGVAPAKVVRLTAALPPRRGELNLGIIGAGNHVRDILLPVLTAMKEVRLRAICTATGLHAKALAEKAGAAYCTADYRELLQDRSIDGVLIGTRHHLHGSMVVEALRAGKHVFVEKPLCLTEEALDEISAAYAGRADAALHLMVGFNRRFSSHIERAKQFFGERKNPLVLSFRVNAGPLPPEHWAHDPDAGGGRIIGEACHFIDTMQALCGAPPVSVHARRIGRHSSGIVDDQSILSLAFGDGSVGTVLYTAGGETALPKERLELFGDRKSFVLDDFMTSEFYVDGKKTVYKSPKRDKGFQEEMARFVGAVLRGEAPPISFDAIRAVTRASFLAVQSFRTGEVYDL